MLRMTIGRDVGSRPTADAVLCYGTSPSSALNARFPRSFRLRTRRQWSMSGARMRGGRVDRLTVRGDRRAGLPREFHCRASFQHRNRVELSDHGRLFMNSLSGIGRVASAHMLDPLVG